MESTPSGAQSQIALYAAADDSEGSTRSAAIYLQARSGNASRVLIRADQFAVFNDDASDFPFLFVGGKAYMRSAFIQDLSVGRAKIGDNAVTSFAGIDGANTNNLPNDGLDYLDHTDILTLNVNVSQPATMLYGVTCGISAASGVAGVLVARNGALVAGTEKRVASGQADSYTFLKMVDVPAGTQQIKIRGASSSSATTAVITYPVIFALLAYK